MIVKKVWKERHKGGNEIRWCQGWYLFGFIPLYVVRKYYQS